MSASAGRSLALPPPYALNEIGVGHVYVSAYASFCALSYAPPHEYIVTVSLAQAIEDNGTEVSGVPSETLQH